jgi:glycine cleavage system regulatory protein
MPTLVLTVIGDDQSGLVEALSGVVTSNGGNWDRSSMARLGNKFAGIVEVSVPNQRVDELVNALGPLNEQGLLDITVEHAGDDTPVEPATNTDTRWELHLIGQDRPGIVHEISQALAQSGVSIEELQTSTSSAPMSGEIMFEATASLLAGPDADLEELTVSLEALADELMVDIDLRA